MSSGPDPPTTARTERIGTGTDASLPHQAPPRRRVLLMVYHRDGVEVVPLVAGTGVVVGREPPADVVIPERSLSRRHARFTLVAAEEAAVEDLESTNGTRIAGRKIDHASVKPGDVVMLGSIAVAVHVFEGAETPALGLEGHDAFRAALAAEIARTAFFGRKLAILMIHAADRAADALPRWCPRIRALLRPIDRIALYGGGTVEILLPETTLDAALELGRAAVERALGEPPLVCGVAFFPGAAASAEELVEVGLDAARRATAESPVRVASEDVLKSIAATGALDEARSVAKSPRMRDVLKTADRVARSAIPVLLQGETGAGKEVLAQTIHDLGPRRERPLKSVNCGAIPATLVESTLFGDVPGAFTGAKGQRGVFEAAEGGTLLLDEIGDLPAAAQVALLRVLETKRVTRVGSTREVEVDVRVIAATHRDLEAMCEAGTFRTDLYYRLNTMVLRVPPLRERREEIAPLAARFLQEAAKENDREIRAISPEALALLERYAWPGNVRELRNVIQRAVVVADGDAITPRDLPDCMRAEAPDPSGRPEGLLRGAGSRTAGAPRHAGSLKSRMEQFERETIVAALREADGNQSETARRLEVPLRTLQHKIKMLGIKRGHYSVGDPEGTV